MMNKRLLFLLMILLIGCSKEDWRDPLSISGAGDGSKLNTDGSPYIPAPGHLTLDRSSMENILMKTNSGPFNTPLVLKNTGTEPLTIKDITTSANWISVDGIEVGANINGIDSVITYISFRAGTTDAEGSVSFTWSSVDNPDSTEVFTLSMDVGDKSAWDIAYDDILSNSCSCHLTSSGAGQLIMQGKETAYINLVEEPANEMPDLFRVDPYDPTNSYLYRKLVGVNITGARMPRNGPPYLTEAKIEQIKQWILIGAPE